MISEIAVKTVNLTVDFRTLVVVVFGFAALISAGSLLLVVQVVRMRRWRRIDESRRLAFEAAWLPVMDDASADVEGLPHVDKRDIEFFIIMLNDAQAQAALREAGDGDELREHLARIALRFHIVPVARRLAEKGNVEERLIGITMLGNLGEKSALPILEKLVDAQNPTLSIAAAHAWIQIDPSFAPRFLEIRLARSDWPPAKVDAIVEQESEALVPALLEAVFNLPEGDRLVRYLAYCEPAQAREAVRRILDEQPDAATIAAALKVLARFGAADDAERAARYIAHDDWRVRVQVAHALASSGDSTQIGVLVQLLADPQWWVRYRAAQAIAELSEDPYLLDRLRDEQEDRFAREMLGHVIAERALAVRQRGALAAV